MEPLLLKSNTFPHCLCRWRHSEPGKCTSPCHCSPGKLPNQATALPRSKGKATELPRTYALIPPYNKGSSRQQPTFYYTEPALILISPFRAAWFLLQEQKGHTDLTVTNTATAGQSHSEKLPPESIPMQLFATSTKDVLHMWVHSPVPIYPALPSLLCKCLSGTPVLPLSSFESQLGSLM